MKIGWNNVASLIALLGLFITLIGTNNRAHAANNAFSVRAFNLQHATQTHQPAISRDSTHEGKVYLAADQMPKLKGTLQELYQKVKYPDKCRKAGVQGRVYVQFIVNKKGIPTHVHVLKGIGNGCDDAAIAAVKKYARFTPGMNDGKTVRVQMTLPILFKLMNLNKVYIQVDKEPRLAMPYMRFQSKADYPQKCREAGDKGIVILEMIINRKGKPRNVHVLKGIGSICDKAAVKAVKKYATFSAAKLHGMAVKTRIKFPVVFNADNKLGQGGKVYMKVSKPAKLKNSSFAFINHIIFTEGCKKADIEGTITVQFVINKEGTPTNIHLTRDIGHGCGQAVVKAIKYLRFTPARQHGKKVRVYRTLTISFNLKGSGSNK